MKIAITAPTSSTPHGFDGPNKELILGLASPICLLLVWEIAVRIGFVDARFFPAPSGILGHLASMIGTGELWFHTSITLQRLFFGFFAGGIPALVIGVVMGLNRTLRAIVEPLIAATYPIPKSAILPLALLVFGLGEASKIFMVALGVFFPVVINATTGVLGISKIYLDVGKNFRASRWNTFRTIALPGAMPVILTGIRLGLGLGLILISIAEMVGAKSGLGYLIWASWETFSVEQMYVGLFVIALIGFVLTAALAQLGRYLVPWR